MGVIDDEREPVCFFCAVMYKTEAAFEKILKELKEKWGSVYKISDKYVFSEITDYYYREMGGPLSKRIVVFDTLSATEKIYESKIISNQMEEEHKKKGLRQINLDPGYLTEAKVLLFSTKDFYHRIYISEGIFGEVTLSYKAKKGYQPFEWTFPDYKNPQIVAFFNETRDWYRLILGRKRKKIYE
ncbi:MAG TPA: hypothetical protein DHW82_01020 [Spirochaetia bacterium]|nr:MAG: hypothetical protein A2Y41_04420 [Spirochaetes bacterium GWB1_36_13]HCL55579.1 hypothetical protein [Spirochaetia bacterium]